MSHDRAVTSSSRPRAGHGSPYIRLAVLAAVLALAGWAAHRLGVFELRDPERFADALRRVRDVPALPVLFVLAYAVATVAGLPGTALTLAGGAIFGTPLGSLLNWTGATLGALGAYALARRLGSDAVRTLLGRHARALDTLTARSGFATLFRLRLIPVVPFNALNFAAGLAAAPFRPYALSTALGIIPGTVVYTYFADSLISGVTGARHRAFLHVAVAGALLIAVSFGPALVRRMRRSRAHVAAILAGSLTLAGVGWAQGQHADHGDFDVLYVSPIFQWYREDFGGSSAAVGRSIAWYYPSGAERRLLESGDFTLRETDYDWSLNRLGGRSGPPRSAHPTCACRPPGSSAGPGAGLIADRAGESSAK
jgi:uncharacterized membrane protein YdjX (TVP38/TMEM64 family)